MGTEVMAARVEPALERFPFPRSVVARFVGRGIWKTALVVACAFGFFVAASILGYAKTYDTEASRAVLEASFGHNPGLNALMGVARNIDTVRGFTAWRTMGVLTIVGAIWALAAATKRFRGEEESGRWELLLSGQTTARGAAANTLAGLGMGLLIIYAVVAAITIAAGHTNDLQFTVGESMFFALALVASTAGFFAVGALASQIAPTRRRAAGIAAGVFGIFFLLRAIGDAAPSAHWLTYLSPLGWIENLRPLTGSSPIWLLPIACFVVILCALTVYLAGKRDLGASLVPDKDSERPRTRFLNTSLGLAVRETRGSIIAWLVAIAAASLAMGAIAKSAGEALSASDSLLKYLGNVTQNPSVFGAMTYLGVIFLLGMTVIMALAAAFINSMREDEAEGYLDNLLVRPISRLRWLRDRLLMVIISVLLAGLAAGIFAWLGAASQRSGVAFSKLLTAGINATIPAAVVIGVGILMLGIRPRLTSTVMWVVIGWSFLLEMIGPAINLNHWILDTSLLHHVAIAPAADPRWSTAAILVGIGAMACVMGGIAFNVRDLAGK